jgi:hypothetical protein
MIDFECEYHRQYFLTTHWLYVNESGKRMSKAESRLRIFPPVGMLFDQFDSKVSQSIRRDVDCESQNLNQIGGEGNPDLSGFSFRFLFQFCFWDSQSIWVSSEPQKPNWNPKTELKCQFYTNLCRFCTRKKLNPETTIEPQFLWEFVFQFGISISIVVFGFNFDFSQFPSFPIRITSKYFRFQVDNG